MRNRKNAIIALLINFFFNGFGYIYLGRKIVFGTLIFAAWFITIVSWYATGFDYSMMPKASFFGAILFNVALAYDAYKIAEEKR